MLMSIARSFYGSTTALIPSRDELPLMLNRRGLIGEAVEVGVQRGLFSELILDTWNGRRLTSVDPWLEADDYVDVANVSQASQDANYEETIARLAKYGTRSRIWRMTSEEASHAVDDDQLDFVYLDARHDFESVKSDLALWYPRVRPGGIIAGHDYLDGHIPAGVFGVKSAVDEFFGRRNLPVASTFQDSPWDSWVVRKPRTTGGQGRLAWSLAIVVRAIMIRARRLRAGVRQRKVGS